MNKAKLGLVLGTIGLISACGGGGGGGNGGNSQDNAPPTTSVSGTVTYNGQPLPGATVVAYSGNSNQVYQTATTDSAGNYSFTGMGTACTALNCYIVNDFFVFKPGYSFSGKLASNPTGDRSNLKWGEIGYGWHLAGGAAAVRAGYNGVFSGQNLGIGAPIVFNDITFNSVPGGSISGANFVSFDGKNPIINLAATGQTASYAAGDDGALRKGVAWPSTRFVDNADGSVTDKLTGLIWLKNAGCLAPAVWATALSEANQLASGQCGLSDGSKAGQWRLPNLVELESVVDVTASNPAVSGPFTNVSNGIYWTSTGYWGGQAGTTNAWAIRMADGRYINNNGADQSNVMKTSINAVWAVRGTSGATVALPSTGAVEPFAAGDDGTLAIGAQLPTPRMRENNDGTITDTVTGLVWLKAANCIQGTWSSALTAIGQLANGQCGLSDGSQAGQWRMPNRREMESLQDRAQNNHALYFNQTFSSATQGVPSQNPIFSNMAGFTYYWTSTTNASNTTEAWAVFSCDYGVYDIDKGTATYSLAVRN